MVKLPIRAMSFAVTASALFLARPALSQNPPATQPLPSLPPPAQTSAPTPPPVYAPPAETLPALPSEAAPPPLPPPKEPEAGEQAQAGKRIGLGLDLLMLIPVGRLADATGALLGPMARIGYRVTPRVEIGLRAGFLFGFNKEQTLDDGTTYSTSQTLIPIWIGGRYFFMRPNAGLYARAEIGLNLLQTHFHSDSDLQGDTGNPIRTRAGFDVGAGYIVSEKLPSDIHVQFTYLNLIGNQTDIATNASDDPFLGIGIGVGYTLSF